MILKRIIRKFSLLFFGICIFSAAGAGVMSVHKAYAVDYYTYSGGKNGKSKNKGGKSDKKSDSGSKNSDSGSKSDKKSDSGSKNSDSGSKNSKNSDSGGSKNSKNSDSGSKNSKNSDSVGDRDGLIDVSPEEQDFNLPDAATSQKNLSSGIDSFMSLLGGILVAGGVILGAYATGKLVMAFHNDNADAKNTAVIMLSMAVIMILMTTILNTLNIKSFFG